MGTDGAAPCGIDPDRAGFEQRKACLEEPEDRARLRLSYGCDCSGRAQSARVNPGWTEPRFLAVQDWTGDRPLSCPWHALRDPFVGRVLVAYEWYRQNQLLVYESEPSARLIDGVTHYHRAYQRAGASADEERRKREKAHG